ncbi:MULTISPECIES: hypothetical protein [Halorussus]|uniref:hypothetical protein n=1 Tax=Halorussus TaxID=1070314 RepID=UPI0013B35E4F|nr:MULTISPECIES: hypothetical protein [Halorussus]NHN58579.1 hypothetical protein [Halorussus sp. JP-T4]
MKRRTVSSAIVGFHTSLILAALALLFAFDTFEPDLFFVVTYVILLFEWEALEVVVSESPIDDWMQALMVVGFGVTSYLIGREALTLLARGPT